MSILSDWFLGQAEIDRGRELDRRLAELNRQKLIDGEVSQAVYDEWQRNIERSTTAGEYAGEIDQAWREGLDEGWNNTTGGIKDALAAPFNFAWSSIPWQLLVLAGVGMFLWMGGAAWLRGILKR